VVPWREAGALGWRVDHTATCELLERYIRQLELPSNRLRVTVERGAFERWLGRRVRASIAGAYAYVPRNDEHLVLINLPCIDLARPRSLEVVVAEELIHMRDRLDGDLRGHAKHGHDRIAHRVARLTGASLEEIRAAIRPVAERPARYVYACPSCGAIVPRRKTGTWSCARCAPRFDPQFTLQLVE
jgi:hypothetical protein